MNKMDMTDVLNAINTGNVDFEEEIIDELEFKSKFGIILGEVKEFESLIPNENIYQKFKNDIDKKYKPEDISNVDDWIENEQPYSEENFAKWLEENLSANNISIDDLEITHKTLPDLYDEFVDFADEIGNNNIHNNNLYSNENFKEWVKDNLASNNLTISELANSIAKEFQIQKFEKFELIPNEDIYQKFKSNIDEIPNADVYLEFEKEINKNLPEDEDEAFDWLIKNRPYSEENFAKWLEENLSANNYISIDDLEITHKTLPDLYDEFVDEVNKNMLNNNIDNNNDLYSDEQFKKWAIQNICPEYLKKEYEKQAKKGSLEEEKTDELANNISIDDLKITYESLPDLYDKFVDEVNLKITYKTLPDLLEDMEESIKWVEKNNPYSNRNFEKWVKDNFASNNLTASELANSVAKELKFKIQETKRKEGISLNTNIQKTTGVKR